MTFRPLFLFWAPHIVHAPAQVPKDAFDVLSFISANEQGAVKRQNYLARVHWIDGAIGRLVASIKAKGMWQNSLMVFRQVVVFIQDYLC